MAISRNSTATGTNDSSSFNITIAGKHVIAFVMYDNTKTLSSTTLAGVSGTILQTINNTGDGYKTSAVSYVGSFSGSQAVAFSWTGGTPTNIRSIFLGYDGTKLIDVSNSLQDTSGTVSATVTASNCLVVGATSVTIGAGASYPSTGTNNDGYAAGAGTNNGLLRWCVGDSNGTVSTGSQSVTTSTTGGYGFGKIIVVLAPSNDYTLTSAYASFSLTGFSAVLQYSLHYTVALAQGAYSLTGQTLSFILNLYTRVTNRVKHATVLVNKDKTASATVVNRTKHASTVTNRQKS